MYVCTYVYMYVSKTRLIGKSTCGGVPQGTKLGPIGFQILINEAAENSSSKCWKYVDDLTFADNSTCAHYPSSSLQADLDDFTKWSKDNMLKLNPSKRQALQVYFGKNLPSLVT